MRSQSEPCKLLSTISLYHRRSIRLRAAGFFFVFRTRHFFWKIVEGKWKE